MGAFDVVVLGGGTAGLHVATEVVGDGMSVALVEAGLVGGESPYLACLPSNSLLLSAARGETWEDAVARRNEVTGGLDDSAPARRVASAGVTVIRGTGRIASPGTVEVTLAGDDEATVSLTYADLVIATGCEPVAPPIEGLADIPAWTTAQSLCSPDLPRRLIVLGGGPAGCELAQIYATFGSQVTLIEAEHTLLPGEPAFAGEILAAALRRAGAEIYLGAPATKAERTPEGLTLALEDGTRIDADRLLLASGRRPGSAASASTRSASPSPRAWRCPPPPCAGCPARQRARPGVGSGRRHRHHPYPRQPLPGPGGRREYRRPAARSRLQRHPALRVHHAVGLRRGHRAGRGQGCQDAQDGRDGSGGGTGRDPERAGRGLITVRADLGATAGLPGPG